MSSEIGTQAALGKVCKPRNRDFRQLLTTRLMPMGIPMTRPIPAAMEKPMAMRTNVALMLGQSIPSLPSSQRRQPTCSGEGNR